ncbi:HTTM domain-containing protein [Thalassotalea sp. ND16A]|uniref:HTTM domain-containing protein n=1 Tax=Thalassotalea sp. ND16A TaxID=1535422 RepID=UPI00051DD41D|nr:HTTM domain-containing protein [Thalassotalea sp. ND16A]KGJ95834.1 hypothetical protein ND16A_1369 [Thalassotalea sp. ND16A]
MTKFKEWLFGPTNIASLVFFRVAFGLIMVIEVGRYFSFGWIESYYIEPLFHFKYYGFSWVQAWPGDGMYWHFALLGIVSLMIMLGLFYRFATIAFVVLFSYVFFIDQTQYLNHFYFVILLGVLLCVVPANKAYSLDVLRKPEIKTNWIPAWTLLIFVVQLEVMYLFAGIVKINPDWLNLQPLTLWLGNRTDFPLIGYLFTETWVVAIASYGAILLHIVGAPLLLFRRTRLWVFLLYAVFHIMNHFLFNIGIFPWLTLIATTLFFDPNWPVTLWQKIQAKLGLDPAAGREYQVSAANGMPLPTAAMQTVIMVFFISWLTIQIMFPLRHLLYPGNSSWTEEGHRFAWQMKLRGKTGQIGFVMFDPMSHKRWQVVPEHILTRRQKRKMACRPDMILQFAHHLAQNHADDNGGNRPQVLSRAWCSLNGRKSQLLIDPNTNLAAVGRDLAPAAWIIPLTEPLR